MAASRKVCLMVLLAAAGCGGRQVALVPPPDVSDQAQDSMPAQVATSQTGNAAASDSVVADTALTPELADSAADEAALTALQELEFGSLDKSAPNLKGALPAPAADPLPVEVTREASSMFMEPRGGAEIAAGPTFDIDVTSFASHKTVKAYMGFFQRLARDRFEIWLSRMARYEGMVRNRFAAQGIPEDLVYLGLIESGFSNTAVSRTKAVGMWQFMPYTARRYGLVVDQWTDERRDPFKATDAAARLLSDLNTEFGSWYLAAAAYNGGSGRVSRGLRRLLASDSASDGTFFRLSDKRYLKRETRDYVPKLIAAALIAKAPSRYGFDPATPLQPLQFDEITVSAQTGLDVLARLADTTAAALLELNPQFFRGVTPPAKTVIVRVPAGNGTRVAQRWVELPAEERVTVIEHIVVRGETISGIAKKYRVDQSQVLAANPRVRPQVLRIGQRLVIPVSISARASYATRAPRRPSAPKPVVAPPAAPLAPAVTPDSTSSDGEFRYHIVQPGETLWLIGRHYGVEVGDLRRWNGLAAGQLLRTGGRLLVGPVESPVSSGASPSP